MDFSALSPAERWIAWSAGLLFLDGFVPWWYRIRTPGGTYVHNAGLTGFSVAAVLLGFAALGAVLIRAARFPERGPAEGVAYAGAGVGAAALLLTEAALTEGEWIGLWVALGLATLLAIGGVRRRAERRAGWI